MADQDASARSIHPSRSPIRVLLIDDDTGFIAAAQTAIAKPPDLICVGVAHSPVNARRLLGELAPDVALVDMGLAGNPLAGAALIAHMREVHPNCEPLAVTVFDDVSTVLAAIQAGASGYVLKGGSAEELCAQIRVVHYGGSPVSPPVARLLLKHLSTGTVRAGGVPDLADAPALSTNESALRNPFLIDSTGRAQVLSRHELVCGAGRRPTPPTPSIAATANRTNKSLL